MKGFSSRNLKYMRRFAEEYKDLEFVQQVAAQLPWFHIVVLLDKVKDNKHRIFYMKKTVEHGWSRGNPPQKQSTKGVEFSRNKEGDSINDNIKAQ